MQEKSRGIVLRSTRYGDSSVIVDIYTEQRGCLAFLVRLPKSRKSALKNVLLHPLSVLELDYDYREMKKLQTLQDVRLHMQYSTVMYEPLKETIAVFLSEFLYYTLRGERENEELFEYLVYSLRWLDTCRSGFVNFPATFLMRLSRFLGFWPDEEEARTLLHEGELAYMPLILRMDFATMHLFRFTRDQRARLMDVLNRYYCMHVPGFPELRSMTIMREVLS